MVKLTKLKKEFQEHGFENMDYDDGEKVHDDTHTLDVDQCGDMLVVTLQSTATWNRYAWMKKLKK